MDYIKHIDDLNNEFQQDAAKNVHEFPWFGQFSIKVSSNTEQSYKLGKQKNAGLRIIDWRHPLAKAYYDCNAGDYYDLDDYQDGLPDAARYVAIAGELRQKTEILSADRRIRKARIYSAEACEVIDLTDTGYDFQALPDFPRHVEGLPDIHALLTKEQYRLIATPTQQPLIIQGQAGSGKTTVALFRVSWLTYPETTGQPVNPANVLIVMFNKALQTFVKGTLKPLGLEKAIVSTFHSWAMEEVRRAYNGEITLTTTDIAGKSVASELKKHAGFLRAAEAFVKDQTMRLRIWMANKLEPYEADDWLAEFDKSVQPVVRKLVGLRTKARLQRNAAEGRERDRLEQIYQVFDRAVKRMTLYKEELLSLMTDQALLQSCLPEVSSGKLDTLAAYQRKLQGMGATPNRPGPCISFDDVALILRLIQLKNGGFPNKNDEEHVNLYDHLVVDEAQDFGAIEMRVLLSAVKSRTGVTIVGDVNQKIIPEAEFIGWDVLAKELGVERAKVAQLALAHRSTRPIMNLANLIIGQPPASGRDGPRPVLTIVERTSDYVKTLVLNLQQLLSSGLDSHICVVCRSRDEASELVQRLVAEAPDYLGPDEAEGLIGKLRLGYNKEFKFDAGITITSLKQIKGLEFDTEIVINPSESNYPENDQGRRYLYTVVTRAKNELRFICQGDPGALIQRGLDDGLIGLDRQTDIIPIQFSPEDDEPF